MRPRFIYDLPSVFASQIQQAESESDRVYEPVIGLVTENKDPDKLGRVKVKLPVVNNDESSWWCPIIMLGAGKNRGWFFIPEVNDEVLVLFEFGDITRPLIVGGMWNGVDKAPLNPERGNPQRIIKSRSGSKITFDDGANTLTVEDGAGIGKIVFEADANKITIEAISGDVVVQAPAGEMLIKCETATFEAGEKVEMVAGSTMQWGCDANVSIKGTSGLSMAGGSAHQNSGNSQAPAAPGNSPQVVPDPVG